MMVSIGILASKDGLDGFIPTRPSNLIIDITQIYGCK